MTRTERQKECIKNWVNANCRATIVAATGVGKTRMALMAIMKLQKHCNDATILVVVPTQVLKTQWEEQLEQYNIYNCSVEIINTVVVNTYCVDLLIVDKNLLTLNPLNCWKLVKIIILQHKTKV